jgi:hypothetical protein
MTSLVTEVSSPGHLRVIHIAFSAGVQLDPIPADHPGAMTTTSLIALNAVLAAAVVAGILRLLVHGIQTDRLAAGHVVERPIADADVHDRLAA